MSKNNDGKYLEDAVEKALKEVQADKLNHFKYRRLPDARTARGMFPAQPADFYISRLWGLDSRVVHLECKTSKNTKRRLPKFTQLPEMRAWSNAGTHGYVLVHFYEIDELWVVNVNDLEEGKPSWVMDETIAHQVETINGALRCVV